LLFDLKLTS